MPPTPSSSPPSGPSALGHEVERLRRRRRRGRGPELPDDLGRRRARAEGRQEPGPPRPAGARRRGARRSSAPPCWPSTSGWTVLADPEGNELCAFPDPGRARPTMRARRPRCSRSASTAIGPRSSRRWWHARLGGTLVPGSDGALRWIDGARGSRPSRSSVVRNADERVAKNRSHWDITSVDADDRPEADQVAELVDLGATLLRAHEPGIRWTVLADPQGNEFCLFTNEWDTFERATARTAPAHLGMLTRSSPRSGRDVSPLQGDGDEGEADGEVAEQGDDGGRGVDHAGAAGGDDRPEELAGEPPQGDSPASRPGCSRSDRTTGRRCPGAIGVERATMPIVVPSTAQPNAHPSSRTRSIAASPSASVPYQPVVSTPWPGATITAVIEPITSAATTRIEVTAISAATLPAKNDSRPGRCRSAVRKVPRVNSLAADGDERHEHQDRAEAERPRDAGGGASGPRRGCRRPCRTFGRVAGPSAVATTSTLAMTVNSGGDRTGDEPGAAAVEEDPLGTEDGGHRAPPVLIRSR